VADDIAAGAVASRDPAAPSLSNVGDESTTPVAVWHTGPGLDRSGTFAYVHLIRAADDPERRPRYKGQDAAPHLTLRRTTTVASWRRRLLLHLADGVPRTFNRCMVELAGLTADVGFDENPDHALWALVDAELVACTLVAPIRFRLACCGR
jgi:hypothetical protein